MVESLCWSVRREIPRPPSISIDIVLFEVVISRVGGTTLESNLVGRFIEGQTFFFADGDRDGVSSEKVG